MRLGFLIDSSSRKAGGLFESVRRLAQSIRTCHDRTFIYSLEDEYTLEDAPAWQPLKLQTFPPKFFKAWGYSPHLLDALLASDICILHTHGIWKYTSLATQRWHKRTGRPHIIHSHGMLDPWAVHHSSIKKRLAGWLYENAHLRSAACLRALCESEAQAMRAFGLRNPICVIPNGIDLPIEHLIHRAPWEDEVPGRKTLLYLGRLHPKKNLVPLLHAWSLMQRDSRTANEWSLAIAGWDQLGYESQLKNLTSELGLQSSVRFLGPLFDQAKAAAYQNASAFILPSLSEGLPMVILEAWAYAKPVLMTPECNLPEGFTSDAAIRIGAGSESIAQGLDSLLALSDEKRAAMGERGLKLVEARFTWGKVGAQMMEVNEWLVNSGPKPQCFYE